MPSAEPSHPNLKEYIASMRKSGFSDDEGRKKLLDAGWDARLVEGALGSGKKTAPGAASSAPARQGVLSPVQLIEDTFNFLSKEAGFWLPFAIALFAIMAAANILDYALFPQYMQQGRMMVPFSDVQRPDILGRMAAVIFIGIVSAVLSLIVQMGFMRGVAMRSEGKPFTFGEGMAVGLSKTAAAVVASILMVVGVVFGLVLLIIPGIYLLVAWALIDPAIAIGDKGALSSFGESRRLINGRWWHAFSVGLLSMLVLGAYMLVVMLMGFAISLMQAVMPGGGPFLDVFQQMVSSAVAVPPTLFILVLLSLFYLNLRENTPEAG